MDARTWSLALNTLLLTGATCAICVPLGSALAWLLVRTDLPGRRPGMGLLAMMLFVPLYLQAAAWQAGFGVQGWMTLGLELPPWLDGWTGAIWVHAVAAVPWVVLIVGAGLLLIEPELEEQALLDASPGQVFLHVTLPGSLPAVGIAALWVAIATAGEIAATDLFVVRTYAEEVYTRAVVGPELAGQPLGGVPGVLLGTASLAAALLLCAKLLPAQRPITLRRRWTFRLGAWRVPLAIVVGLTLLLLVGVPLVNLCYKSGVLVVQTDAGRLRHWSALKCLAAVALAPWQYRREFGYSLGIGALAAAAAVFLATVLASAMKKGISTFCRNGPEGASHKMYLSPFSGAAVRGSVLLLIAACLAVPGPAIGLGIIRLLNQPHCPAVLWLYDRSILAPWLAMLLRSLPLATLIMWHALQTLPRGMLEAAAADGAGPIRRLVWIALPCRLPAVALAFVVAIAVSLGDLAASVLVVPPGVTTLSIRIFGLLHSSVEDQVAGICLAMLAIFACAAALAAWSAARCTRRQRDQSGV